MNIQQHYLLNLKRRPERLYAWIGSMDAMAFDFERLTVFEAFDATNYRSIGEMLKETGKYFEKNGLDYRQEYNHIASDNKPYMNGLIANMISKLLMLLDIEKAEDPSVWFMLWEDDVVLKKHYQDLIAVQPPEGATMFAFHANQAFAVNKEGAHSILEVYRKKSYLGELENFLRAHPDMKGLIISEKKFTRVIRLRDFISDIFPTSENKRASLGKHAQLKE